MDRIWRLLLLMLGHRGVSSGFSELFTARMWNKSQMWKRCRSLGCGIRYSRTAYTVTPTLCINPHVRFCQDVLSGIPSGLHPCCELIYWCHFVRLCYQESQRSLHHCCGTNYRCDFISVVYLESQSSLHTCCGMTYRCDFVRLRDHNLRTVYTHAVK